MLRYLFTYNLEGSDRVEEITVVSSSESRATKTALYRAADLELCEKEEIKNLKLDRVLEEVETKIEVCASCES